MFKSIYYFSFLFFAFIKPVAAFCFSSAGSSYQIDPLLLIAIAQVESGMNPKAININKGKDGKRKSEDVGLMQINSIWLGELQGKWGITRKHLLDDACQNVYVGAYILAKNISKNGVNWQSIGAYNAGFANYNEPARERYSKKVYGVYLGFLAGDRNLIIGKASRGEKVL